MEESEKKFQSSQDRLEELVAMKKRLSDVEADNKALEASKEVQCTIIMYMYMYKHMHIIRL